MVEMIVKNKRLLINTTLWYWMRVWKNLRKYGNYVWHILNFIHITVPSPNVSALVHNSMMMVGQPLTLECIATTIRGINSQVDIVWTNVNNGMELRRSNNVIGTMANFNSVYRDYFNILQLTTDHNDVKYECKVIINANLLVMATGNLTLDVIGKYMC